MQKILGIPDLIRKIYNKYFKIPETGKLDEKVFYARITVSAICIVLCLAALGFNAYAYFTSDITSSQNVIASAGYDLEVVCKQTGTDTVIEAQPLTTEESEARIHLAKTYVLPAGDYEFSLTKGTVGASTGYAMIRVEEQEALYTYQIGVTDENGTEVSNRVVRIYVAQETKVTITPCWGTYSGIDQLSEELSMIMFSKSSQEAAVKIPKSEFEKWKGAQTSTTSLNNEETTTEETKDEPKDEPTGTEPASTNESLTETNGEETTQEEKTE